MTQKRSRIALITRAMDVVFGLKTGTHGESGWGQGQYLNKARLTVCLNAALFTAERDLFIGDTGGTDNGVPVDKNYSGPLRTQEGIDTQRLLAETILEMYPDTEIDPSTDPLRLTPDAAHAVIVSFNDGGADAESMEAVFRKTEDKAFAKWLDDHPTFGTASDIDQSFVDYALGGNAS